MVVEIGSEIVNVILADDMPIGMPEHIWKNADDSYTIKLNAKYDHETLKESFEHAAKHIRSGDWEKEDVQQIEAEAHRTEQVPAPAPDHFDDELPEWLTDLIMQFAVEIHMLEKMEEYMEERRRLQNRYQTGTAGVWEGSFRVPNYNMKI